MKSLLSVLKAEDQIVSEINAINEGIEKLEIEYERAKAYPVECSEKWKQLFEISTKIKVRSNDREKYERELVSVRDELRLYFAALSVRLI